MKYIRKNPWGLTYIWESREVGARCTNQKATLLPGEAYQFAEMERNKVPHIEAGGAEWMIEGMAS